MPGKDHIITMATKSLGLLMTAQSVQSRAEIQIFQQGLLQGLTPNALDTLDITWDKISCSLFERLDNKSQAAMSFVQF